MSSNDQGRRPPTPMPPVKPASQILDTDRMVQQGKDRDAAQAEAVRKLNGKD